MPSRNSARQNPSGSQRSRLSVQWPVMSRKRQMPKKEKHVSELVDTWPNVETAAGVQLFSEKAWLGAWHWWHCLYKSHTRMLWTLKWQMYRQGWNGAEMVLSVKKATITHVWELDLWRVSKAFDHDVQGKNRTLEEVLPGLWVELGVTAEGRGGRPECAVSLSYPATSGSFK